MLARRFSDLAVQASRCQPALTGKVKERKIMANQPIDNNELNDDEDKPESEDELEMSYTISESDMVVDLDDYDREEIDSDDEWEEELAEGTLYDTQHTDGSTHNPEEAWEQGLVYIPPEDPPVLPSDEQQGVEIAAGFAPSGRD
jgi:hypothetical protein